MIYRRIGFAFGALLALVAISGAASAHPHVFVTMKSELVYAKDGSITGVRHAWTFDDMFSAFATQGLESKEKGKFTRQELEPLAKVNIESLKEFDFFTYAKTGTTKHAFVEPKEYHLEFNNSVLTLHFLLPLQKVVKTSDLSIEVYDPSYFVDFVFAEKDPVSLAGAPPECKLTVAGRGDPSKTDPKKLGEAFFQQLDSQNYGAMFANKIVVKC
jgi:ABC-type uncharacterized transport system substrate-binding protein